MPSVIKRLLGSFGLGAIERPKAFNPQGVSGTAIYSGYPVQREKSSRWIGQQKYITSTDLVLNTSIVAASVHHFLNLVAHPEWTVRPADDQSKEAQDVADLVESSMHEMQTPWTRVVRRSAMYRFHGFGVQEWWAKKRADGTITFGDIEPRPQFTIERWEVDESGQVTGCYQRSPQTSQVIGLPRSKLIYMVDDTLTDSPEGIGIFRHLGEPYERLKGFQELEVRAYERDLRGTPIGRAPLTLINRAITDGTLTKEEGAAIVQHLTSFVQTEIKKSDTGVILDSMVFESQAADGLKVSGTPQWGLDLLTGPGIGLAELSSVIDRLQREMARIIGTEMLMMGDAGGNRALAVDKSRHLYLICNSVLSNIAATYETDYILPLMDLNGIDVELKPSFEVEDVTFKDVAEVANALATMARAGAVLSPDDPAIGDVRDLLGIQRPPEPTADQMGAVTAPGPTAAATQQAAGTDASATATVEAAKKFREALLKDKANSGVPSELDKFLAEHWDEFNKYNPNHDPATGEFASGESGGGNVSDTSSYKLPNTDAEITDATFARLPEAARTAEGADKVYLQRLEARATDMPRQRGNRGVTMYHEAPGDVKRSMERNGIKGDYGIFAAVGEPSNFVTSSTRTIVEFQVPLSEIRAEAVVPDMSLVWSDKMTGQQMALLEHPDLQGSYVSISRDYIPPSWIKSIRVETKKYNPDHDEMGRFAAGSAGDRTSETSAIHGTIKGWVEGAKGVIGGVVNDVISASGRDVLNVAVSSAVTIVSYAIMPEAPLTAHLVIAGAALVPFEYVMDKLSLPPNVTKNLLVRTVQALIGERRSELGKSENDPTLTYLESLLAGLEVIDLADYTKYNPNHAPAGSPSGGEFTSAGDGGGDGSGAPELSLRQTKQRAFNGEPVEIKNALTRQEAGALGEHIVTAHLKREGLSDARPLNLKTSNFPVDLVGDHELIEVKTGLASNGKAAQQWRATIGQPGKAETAWLKTASADEKSAWNERKSVAIMARKAAVVKQYSAEMGRPIAGKTMTVILNPDKRIADVYEFDGFHARIGWKSAQAEAGYVRSYKY